MNCDCRCSFQAAERSNHARADAHMRFEPLFIGMLALLVFGDESLTEEGGLGAGTHLKGSASPMASTSQ